MRNGYHLFIFILLALLGTSPASAQPAPNGADLLAAWRTGWERGLQSVASVNYIETTSRSIEGPREHNRFTEVASVGFSSGSGMRRSVQRRELNDRPIPPIRLNALNRRMRRAYGAGFDWFLRPPTMAVRLAGVVRPTGSVLADVVGDARAWRVTSSPGGANDTIERVIFWFAQVETDSYPRLLRTHIIGRVPVEPGRVQGGSAIVKMDYARVGGLDLPRSSQTEVVIQQNRRRLVFTVLLNVETAYRSVSVSPR